MRGGLKIWKTSLALVFQQLLKTCYLHRLKKLVQNPRLNGAKNCETFIRHYEEHRGTNSCMYWDFVFKS